METKFKTNIKCSGCVAAVTPFLNEAVGQGAWSVDVNSPDKVLTIKEDKEKDAVINAIQKAGYKAEQL